MPYIVIFIENDLSPVVPSAITELVKGQQRRKGRQRGKGRQRVWLLLNNAHLTCTTARVAYKAKYGGCEGVPEGVHDLENSETQAAYRGFNASLVFI